MAGHSKWANIQHRKGAQDKKRAVLFARLSKEITIASKMGGPDPAMNPRLRLAVSNAKGQSVPKDNIQRAIDKGQGGGGEAFEDVRYEGVGPGGVGVIVEASTDNRNRAASEIRTAFSKNGGNLGETGSVSFGFENVGEIVYPLEVGDEMTVREAAIEAGASGAPSVPVRRVRVPCSTASSCEPTRNMPTQRGCCESATRSRRPRTSSRCSRPSTGCRRRASTPSVGRWRWTTGGSSRCTARSTPTPGPRC